MDLKVFKAPTMAEALTAAKAEFGAAAVILHTRSVQHKSMLGLRKTTRIELTVARNLPKPRRPEQPRGQSGREARRAPVRPDAPAAKMPAPHHAEVPPPALVGELPSVLRPGEALMQTPAAQTAQLRSLNKEVADLRELVKDVVRAQHKQIRPDLPGGLRAAYMQLLSTAVADELANDIVCRVKDASRPAQLADDRHVRGLVAKELARLVPTSGPIRRDEDGAKGRPHVLALVGPTGVGKTTTVAKLAANLKLRDGHKVGLITLDTYRLAAVEQLRKYADIIGAELAVVASPGEIKNALKKLADCDFVLIDTAGRSPKAEHDLEQLRRFLDAAAPDEVHLVLSGASSPQQLELVTERFAKVRVDKVIFTKLDEAAQVGVVLNVAAKLGKQLSYVTTGQDVPADIEVSDARRLARLILGEELTPPPAGDDEKPAAPRRVPASAGPARREPAAAPAAAHALGVAA